MGNLNRWNAFSTVIVAAYSLAGYGATGNLAKLNAKELSEVKKRLHFFYRDPKNPLAMNQSIPKFNARTGKAAHPHQMLRLNSRTQLTGLLETAQAKQTDRFRNFKCSRFYKKHFPSIACSENFPEASWASVEKNDRVDDLTDSWLSSTTHDLDEIPTDGTTQLPLWSDDYWRLRWGITSFRYSDYDEDNEFETYKEAVSSYAQPADWNALQDLALEEITRKTVRWSPAEKYDLTVGDETFLLTNQQKDEGKASLGSDGNVEEWMGICHGWALASVMVPKAIKPVTMVAPNHSKITWYPGDVRAMASLAWANGDFLANNVGGRCTAKKPETYPNGRLKQQSCFDTNPATFHLALGNMIGREKVSFVMDSTFDYEVWNQPIQSYDFLYFNPNDPEQTDKDWKKVAVNYDDTFTDRDRFQTPLTRGVRSGTEYDDSGIKKVVGVIATVVYLLEQIPPTHSSDPTPEEVLKVTYTYDLELGESGGELVPTGGEWHENTHPDFLWLPRKDSFAASRFDRRPIIFSGFSNPEPDVTLLAQEASAEGLPLCQVVKRLVEESSGEEGYRCPTDRKRPAHKAP